MSENLEIFEKFKKFPKQQQPNLLPEPQEKQKRLGGGSDYETVRERVELLPELEKYEEGNISRRDAISFLKQIYGESLSKRLEKFSFEEVINAAIEKLKNEKNLLEEKRQEAFRSVEKRISQVADMISMNSPQNEDLRGNKKIENIFETLQLDSIYKEVKVLKKNINEMKKGNDVMAIPNNYMIHLLGNLDSCNAIFERVEGKKEVEKLIPSFGKKTREGLSYLQRANQDLNYLKELLETQSGREGTLH